MDGVIELQGLFLHHLAERGVSGDDMIGTFRRGKGMQALGEGFIGAVGLCIGDTAEGPYKKTGEKDYKFHSVIFAKVWGRFLPFPIYKFRARGVF